jgi:hypothetical protein
VYTVAFVGSGPADVVLQPARQDWAAGVGSRTVHWSMNCAMAYHYRSGVFPLVTFEQIWRGATANYHRVSLSRECLKAVPITSGKQPGTARDNSEVFWPKSRISALESNIPAFIFAE